MRIAVISDIHANVLALQAVLDNIEQERADRIICLGDVAVTGHQPREAMRLLRSLGCPVVMGNCDEWLLDPKPFEDGGNGENARRIYDIDQWCLEQLAPDDLDFVRTFRPTVEVLLDDGATLLCFHGSPQSNTEIIVATTPDEELEQMLDGAHATIMAGGHTHQPMLRRFRETTIINPGSVGLPYIRLASGAVTNPPWAEYAIISYQNGALGIDLRRVPIDRGAIVKSALESGMPHAQWWAKV
jgi:putative phosphoesterase